MLRKYKVISGSNVLEAVALRRARKEVGQTKAQAEAMALAGEAKRRTPTTPPNLVPRLMRNEDPCPVWRGGGGGGGGATG